MILHTNTKCWAWRCDTPGCTGPRSCGGGYGSDRAARRAQERHTDTTHPVRTPAAGPAAVVLALVPGTAKAGQPATSRLLVGVAA
jgi:hypothetical protein